MPGIKNILKQPLTKAPVVDKSYSAYSIPGLLKILKHFLEKALRHFQPRSNPFADSSGHPRKGYRKQFYEFELQKRERYLNTLSKETKNQIITGRRAFFERMQS